MLQTNQYYFSVQKLETLLKQYKENPLGNDGTLLGFVFSPGIDSKGNQKIFASPLFDAHHKSQANVRHEMLIQSSNETVAGCPYPPKCRE